MARQKHPRGREVKKEYRMCSRKRKYKSSEAGRVASMSGHRKYRCPYCNHWHMTKKREGYD